MLTIFGNHHRGPTSPRLVEVSELAIANPGLPMTASAATAIPLCDPYMAQQDSEEHDPCAEDDNDAPDHHIDQKSG